MSYNLIINSLYWNRDSNSLFDYDADDYIRSSLKINKNGVIYLIEKNLNFSEIKNKITFPSLSTLIAKCYIRNDIFELDLEDDNTIQKNDDDKLPWIIVRHTTFGNKNGYKLREGNVIKFGKTVFKITEIKHRDEKQFKKYREGTFGEGNRDEQVVVDYTDNNLNNNDMLQSVNNVQYIKINKKEIKEVQEISNTQKNAPICRVCWSSDHDSQNPLLRPCNCSGSVKYIHLFCLQQSFKSKIVTKVYSFHTVYAFKPFECEICKKPIPDRIEVRNEIITLIDFQKPENNYIILETMTKERSETKYIYIIQMNEKTTLKIGRSNESDVRMSDISISRNHAMIKSFNSSFYLEDNNSKFGSLVQTNNKLIVLPYKRISLQIGRFFYTFDLKKTFLACLSCYKPKSSIITDYNLYLEDININKKEENNTSLEKISKYESDKYDSNIEKKSNHDSENNILTHNDKLKETLMDHKIKSMEIKEIVKNITYINSDEIRNMKRSLSLRCTKK